jgi:hypothetical protein
MSNKELNAQSLLTNGFDIYRMRRRNKNDLIRIKSVSNNCTHNINQNEVVLEIDNHPVNEWSYDTLLDHISKTVIESIITESYDHYIQKLRSNYRINKFSIYIMKVKNIPRIKKVWPDCKFTINVGDVVIKIDEISISEWSINNLIEYVSNTTINSIETKSYKDYTKAQSHKYQMSESLRLNSFDIYHMHSNTNVIRIKSISSMCVHEIQVGDIIIHINNIPIENWSYVNLCSFLATNIISSIETKRFKRKRSSNIDNETVNSQFVDVKQEWDYENPCLHCGCIHLKKAYSFRNKCCCSGKYIHSSNYPHLTPLPPKIKKFATELINHFARNSVSYNNVLALGNFDLYNNTIKIILLTV